MKFLKSRLYRAVEAAIVVYSVGSKQSFDRVPYWLEQLTKKSTNTNIVTLIVGNKCDLQGDFREVLQEQGEDFCRQQNLHFFETSAKEDKNVTEAFELLLELVLFKKIGETRETLTEPNITLHSQELPLTDDGCC